MSNILLSEEERKSFLNCYRRLIKSSHSHLQDTDIQMLKQYLKELTLKKEDVVSEPVHPLLRTMQTALIVVDEMGLGRVSIISVMLYEAIAAKNQ